jgi:hypothetical protein
MCQLVTLVPEQNLGRSVEIFPVPILSTDSIDLNESMTHQAIDLLDWVI